MKKILLSLVILSFGFSLGISEASLVYTTVNGDMGLVNYDEISGDMTVYTREYSTQNIAIVASYLHNGNSKTLLVEPDDLTLDEGGSWDRFYLFNSVNLTTPENDDEDLRLTGISEATSIVTAVNGEQTSVFVTDNNGSIAEYRSGNNEPRNYFSYTDLTGYKASFLKAIIAGERLFVLNKRFDENYNDYEILRFDGLLERNRSFASLDLGSDVNDIAVTSSGLIFATYDDGIRQYKNSKTVEDILLFEDSRKATAIYATGKTTFYFVIEDSDANESTLAYYDGTTPYEVYKASGVGTVKSQITYDSKNKLLGAIIGDGIIIVDNSDTTTFTVSDFITSDKLGGVPVSIAFVGASTTTNKSSSSGSGGCDSVSLSLFGALLLALPLISRKK